MELSLIIFIVLIIFFAYRGFKKGWVKSLSWILVFLAGCLAVILYSDQVSEILETQFQLQGIAALITASLALFIGAGMVINSIFSLIEKRLQQTGTASTASSWGGAVVGAMVGMAVAVTIVWTITFARDMMATPEAESFAETEHSTFEDLVNRVASRTVGVALSLSSAQPEVVSLSRALVEAPAEVSHQVRRLAKDSDLRALLGNPANRSVLDSGDIEAVRQLPVFQNLARNPDILALAKSTGLLDGIAGDREAAEMALAIKTTEIWARWQRVKTDKRVQEILADPEIQQKIQSGDAMGLLTDRDILELAELFFEKSGHP